jgi:Acyltransferase family
MTLLKFKAWIPPSLAGRSAGHHGDIGASDRLSGVDLIRLVSVAGLVWFHIGAPWAEFAYAGLPTVMLFSVALPMMSGRKRPFFEEVSRRGLRLLPPWIFWSGFYGAWIVARSLYRGYSLGPLRRWENLLIGPTIHLWYLPFAFLVTLAALVLRRGAGLFAARYVCLVGGGLGGVMLVLCSLASRTWALEAPFGQWAFAASAIPFGIAVGAACRARPARVYLALASVALAGVVSCAVVERIGDHYTAISYGIGIPLACAALLWRFEPNGLVRVLAPLSMGLYVLHPFITDQIYRLDLVRRFPALTATASILVTLALTLVLRKTPIQRYL